MIARLNIGGPAIQAITLTRELQSHGYRTTLVRGREEPGEGSMDDLAATLDVHPVLIPWLRRNPGSHDLRALVALVRLIRRRRPHVVHTHAAKAGTLGRLAVLLAFPRPRSRPILVHTYHGHSLTGYFSSGQALVYRLIERVLARASDRLVAVSEEVRDDLVSLGVAHAESFQVVHLGFDLSPFLAGPDARQRARRHLREELGISAGDRVATLIARLVPIKRVDRFLALARSLSDLRGVRFVVVGDGELRDQLSSSADARALGERLIWAGFRRDIPRVCFASDVVVQTSDNEGTPVALIEAQAAGLPVVSTDVGGTRTVVAPGETGLLASADDAEALSNAVRQLLTDPELAAALGQRGSERALALFGLERLVAELDELYRGCLATRAGSDAGSEVVRSRS